MGQTQLQTFKILCKLQNTKLQISAPSRTKSTFPLFFSSFPLSSWCACIVCNRVRVLIGDPNDERGIATPSSYQFKINQQHLSSMSVETSLLVEAGCLPNLPYRHE